MCGLFGAAGPALSSKDIEAINVLGNLTEVRGKHSTGLFTGVRTSKGNSPRLKFNVHKSLKPATVFMASKPVKHMLEEKPFIVGGHCRLATHGTIKVKNAHPFSVGHFIGTHNGVIADLFDQDNDKTDSQVLFENMQRDGVVKGIQSGLDGGDMALVFVNKSNNTLNYYRNSGRPLWIAVDKDKRKFFWASQEDFLEFLEKNRLAQFSSRYFVAPNLLHSVDLRSFKRTITEIKPEAKSSSRLPWYQTMRESRSAVNSGAPRPLPAATSKVSTARPADLVYTRHMWPTRQTSWDIALKPNAQVVEDEYYSKVPPAVTTPSADEKEGPRIFFRGFSDKLLPVTETSKYLLGKYSSCDCCGMRPRTLFKPIHWLSEKSYLCNDCFNDEEIMSTCYEGITFYTGEFVDKNGNSKARKKDDIIPF